MREAYTGFRNTTWARTFPLQFLIRRFLFALLLGLLQNDLNKITKIAILTGLQLLYLISLIVFRPYATKKDNWLEIGNEVIFFLLSGLLLYYNTLSRWEDYIEYIYYALIILAAVYYCVIPTIFIIIHLCTREKGETKVENYEKPKAQESDHSKSSEDLKNIRNLTPKPVAILPLYEGQKPFNSRNQELQDTAREESKDNIGYRAAARREYYGNNITKISNPAPYYKKYPYVREQETGKALPSRAGNF